MKKKSLSGLILALRRFSKARDWGQFHSPKNLAMAMSVEAGEVVEIFQWLTEDQSRNLSKEGKAALEDELADVFLYLLNIADKCGVDLVQASFRKMVKNAKKYPAGKSKDLDKKYASL
jgi:dCTP diphosphatase